MSSKKNLKTLEKCHTMQAVLVSICANKSAFYKLKFLFFKKENFNNSSISLDYSHRFSKFF